MYDPPDRKIGGFRNPIRYRVPTFFTHRNMVSRTRYIWMPVGSATATVGTPTFGAQGANKVYQGWSFPNSATGTVVLVMGVPQGIVEEIGTTTAISNFSWRLHWTNLGAGTGNVVWEVDYAVGTTAQDLNAALQAGTPQTIAAPTQNVLKTSTWPGGSNNGSWPSQVSATDLIAVAISRNGANVADTLANAAGLVGLTISYTADM